MRACRIAYVVVRVFAGHHRVDCILLDIAGRGCNREIQSGIMVWHASIAISSLARCCSEASGEPWSASSDRLNCKKVAIDRGWDTWPPEQGELRKHAVVSALRKHNAHETR